MDQHLARYIFSYYSKSMTEKENLANRHLLGPAKAAHARSDLAPRQVVKNSNSRLRKLLGRSTSTRTYA